MVVQAFPIKERKRAELTKTLVRDVQYTYSRLSTVPLLPFVPLRKLGNLQSSQELGNHGKHIMRMSMGEPVGTLIH
jgi:hypothetical protein